MQHGNHIIAPWWNCLLFKFGCLLLHYLWWRMLCFILNWSGTTYSFKKFGDVFFLLLGSSSTSHQLISLFHATGWRSLSFYFICLFCWLYCCCMMQYCLEAAYFWICYKCWGNLLKVFTSYPCAVRIWWKNYSREYYSSSSWYAFQWTYHIWNCFFVKVRVLTNAKFGMILS